MTRHFMFLVPSGPPALEVFVNRDLTNEPSDGVFETGLVKGYVAGFSGKGVRRPSLTFLTVRPRADAGADLEAYLARVRLR